MKKLVLVILAVVLVSSSAFAEGGPKAGQLGLQTSVTFTTAIAGLDAGDLGAKFMITDALAVRAGLGLKSVSAGGVSTTLFDLGAGFEYHFGGKGGVSPYAGAEISYSTAASGGTSQSEFGLNGVFGGEYFFSSNFSWAGEARLGFRTNNIAGTTTTTIGTAGLATSLTWYIN
jgi:hypothetical protein